MDNKFTFLSLEQAERLTEKRTRGFDAFWEGWDLVIWRPNGEGFIRENGMFRNGKWGTYFRVRPNVRGCYKVTERVASALDEGRVDKRAN